MMVFSISNGWFYHLQSVEMSEIASKALYSNVGECKMFCDEPQSDSDLYDDIVGVMKPSVQKSNESIFHTSVFTRSSPSSAAKNESRSFAGTEQRQEKQHDFGLYDDIEGTIRLTVQNESREVSTNTRNQPQFLSSVIAIPTQENTTTSRSGSKNITGRVNLALLVVCIVILLGLVAIVVLGYIEIMNLKQMSAEGKTSLKSQPQDNETFNNTSVE